MHLPRDCLVFTSSSLFHTTTTLHGSASSFKARTRHEILCNSTRPRSIPPAASATIGMTASAMLLTTAHAGDRDGEREEMAGGDGGRIPRNGEEAAWRNEKATYSTFEDAQQQQRNSHSILDHHHPRPRRTFGVNSLLWPVLTLFLLLGFHFYVWGLRISLPPPQEHINAGNSAQTTNSDEYAVAKSKHHFHGQRLLDLDLNLVPGGQADKHGKRRLVFVGDIHGCKHELEKLLHQVDFDSRTDHLIAVGDVISKGPDNVGVLDHLIRLNATSVRGNHEDRILALAPSIQASADPTADDELSEKSKKDAALLRQLSPQHLQFLYDMPLMLRIPPLPQAAKTSSKTKSPIGEEILVVHAGLVPAVPLKKQDPYFVMNMRAIHTKTHRPFVEAESKKAKTKPWHDIWCWYNERLFEHKSLKDFQIPKGDEDDYDPTVDNVQVPLSQSSSSWSDWTSFVRRHPKWPKPQVVIYGHRSKEGLQLERWSKGLDTGCVSGGKLTALVLDARGGQEIVQVRCEDHR